MNDRELLRRYVEERSEQAFGELVRRHINLVYATALRLAGQPGLAEDVTQTVFIQLARKARSVRQVAGWLYRSACGTAKDALRADRRRQAREAEAMKLSELNAVPDGEWRALAPLLDEALATLNDKEQNAIILRFLEGKSLRETGQALAMTEDAAQKRVSRALEKLRVYFARRDVTASSALIVSALATPAAQAAPAGLAAAVAGHSLAGASAAGTTVLGGIIETIFMTKAKATVISAIIVAAAATAVIQARKVSSLRNEIIVLRGQHAEEVRRLRTQRAAATTGVAVEQPAITPLDIEATIHAIARPGNWRRHREWQDFLEALKVTDIPTALAVVEKLNDPQLIRHVWRDNLLRQWARTDPAAALAYCQTMKERGERESAFSSLVGLWAENDAAGARAWVEQISDWKLRQRALWAIASCSIQENPLATVDLIERLGEWNSVPLEDVFNGWAQTDLAGAFAKAMELPSSQRSKALAAIGRSWAASDPQAALAWAETLPAGSEKDDVLDGVITRWAYTDQKDAITYLATLPAGRMRDQKLSGMVYSWATVDAAGALAWSQTLADNDARQKAVSTAIYWMVGDGPRETVATAESLPGEDKKTALRTAARTWAKHDPEAAQAYAPQTSDEEARTGYLTGLIEGLTESSPAAAAHLVANVPASTEREGMVRRIVERLGSRDPAMAAAWVGNLSEDEFRNELLYEVARIWTHKDSAAAKAWVDSLPKERAWDGAFRGHARQMQMKNNRARDPRLE